MAGQKGCGKFRLQPNSIPGQSNWLQVAIVNTLFGTALSIEDNTDAGMGARILE